MKKMSVIEAVALFVSVAISTFFIAAWFLVLHQTRNEMRAEASLQRLLDVANVSYSVEGRGVSDRLPKLITLVNENVDQIEGLEGCVYYIDCYGNLQYYVRP